MMSSFTQENEPTKEQKDAIIHIYKSGRYSDAMKSIQSIISRYPCHPFGWTMLGVIYGDMGRSTAAIDPMRYSAKLAHNDPSAHYNLGIALNNVRSLDDSESRIKYSIILEPAFDGAYFFLSGVSRGLKRLEEAVDFCKRAIYINPSLIKGYLSLYNDLVNLGRNEEAISIIAKAIYISPGLSEHYCSLSRLFYENGSPEKSIDNSRRAILISPKSSQSHEHLGNILLQSGLLSDSELCYRNTIAIEPDHNDAHVNLGRIAWSLGRPDESLVRHRRAVRIMPDNVDAYVELGNALLQLALLKESELAYREALILMPDNLDSHINFGTALRALDRLVESERRCKNAINIAPEKVEAHFNLGNTLYDTGRFQESMDSYREAISIRPDYSEAYVNLGKLLFELGRLEESEAASRKALRINHTSVEARINIGNALCDLGRLDESEAIYREAILVNTDSTEAMVNLGNVLRELGRADESESTYREALRLNPDSIEARSNLLFLISHLKKTSPANYLMEAKSYGSLLDKKLNFKFKSWLCVHDPKKLRIGLISGDLRNHPVGYFIEGMCRYLSSGDIELIAFSAHHEVDDLSRRIEPSFTEWHSICGLSDIQAAQVVYNSKIHVLLDLSGHTAHNRLGIFACKPAPVQVSWLGYWASTGVSAIDYLLGDPYVTPHAEDDNYTESVWRLPHTRFCFTAPTEIVSVEEPPFLRNNFVTFGCLSSLSKITNEVLFVWSRILKNAPTSKLFLKAKQLSESRLAEQIKQYFEADGIAPQRLILEGPSPRIDYLKTYNSIDLVLDTFPYTGGTTTAESLWMGVPVLTMRGNTLLSRQGEGILQNSLLTQWIASDVEDYITKAQHCALNPELFFYSKEIFRRKIMDTPFFNCRDFSLDFEHALWAMWNKYSDVEPGLT